MNPIDIYLAVLIIAGYSVAAFAANMDWNEGLIVGGCVVFIIGLLGVLFLACSPTIPADSEAAYLHYEKLLAKERHDAAINRLEAPNDRP